MADKSCGMLLIHGPVFAVAHLEYVVCTLRGWIEGTSSQRAHRDFAEPDHSGTSVLPSLSPSLSLAGVRRATSHLTQSHAQASVALHVDGEGLQKLGMLSEDASDSHLIGPEVHSLYNPKLSGRLEAASSLPGAILVTKRKALPGASQQPLVSPSPVFFPLPLCPLLSGKQRQAGRQASAHPCLLSPHSSQ